MSDIDLPRLRAIEAFPVEHQGGRYIALRDPSGYTATVLMLPQAAVEVVALLDGAHSLLDIQAEITRRYGEIVPQADLERIVSTLDEHGFLDSPRFAALREATDAGFLAAASRPAAHAGGAYAEEPAELRRALDGFFTHAIGPGPAGASDGTHTVSAIIAPHIDFHRGGPAYAWAYRDVAERCQAEVFVIFGTCHAAMPDPFALTLKDYETPLGPAPVDREIVEMLAARTGAESFASETFHRMEHSIEFQAVFLQYLFGGRRPFTIVPVLTSFAHEAMARGGSPEDDPRVGAFLDALADVLAARGRRSTIIAGADLAHVGPRFGDPRPVSAAQRTRIEREDREMLAAVEAGDAAGFFASVARDGDSRRICGLSPIYALLRMAGGQARGALRHYGQSPDPQGVVSYASVVYDGR
jgi:AmmeMemoRadiSam system protein B